MLREQRKQRERVELKMDLPGVSIADEGETGMFSLRTIRGQQVREGWRYRGSSWRVWRWRDIGLNALSDRSVGLDAVFTNKIGNGNSRKKK